MVGMLGRIIIVVKTVLGTMHNCASPKNHNDQLTSLQHPPLERSTSFSISTQNTRRQMALLNSHLFCIWWLCLSNKGSLLSGYLLHWRYLANICYTLNFFHCTLCHSSIFWFACLSPFLNCKLHMVIFPGREITFY